MRTARRHGMLLANRAAYETQCTSTDALVNVIFNTHATLRCFRCSRLTALAFAATTIATPAYAADVGAQTWQSLLVAHAGWTALAGLGLIAVAIAARVRRPRINEAVVDGNGLAYRVAMVPAKGHAVVMATNGSDSGRPRGDATSKTPERQLRAQTADPDAKNLFLALHHVDLSIDVLHRHLEREPRPMPAVWLMLLDLARTHGREQTFCELALEFHQRFNVRTPSWESFPPGRDEPGLEAYPRLVKEITLSWGTHDCRRLLDRLLYDNRGGQRRGFTLNAYNDLIALKRACDAVLDTIDQDLAEEAKLRSAFATAAAAMDSATLQGDAVAMPANLSPLVRELESELDADLRERTEPQSALEREHPAFASMLAREWGNAALTGRLCEMLSRSGDSPHAVSAEAAEEIELLRRMTDGHT